MITALLIVLLILAVGGGGYGWHSGNVGLRNVLGLLVVVLIFLILLSAFGPLNTTPAVRY